MASTINLKKNPDKGKVVFSVFRDISKAFERDLNRRLIYELLTNMISWNTSNCQKNYRNQKVGVCDKYSDWLIIGEGVPMGSIFEFFLSHILMILLMISVLQWILWWTILSFTPSMMYFNLKQWSTAHTPMGKNMLSWFQSQLNRITFHFKEKGKVCAASDLFEEHG